jgi:hypothetical protein
MLAKEQNDFRAPQDAQLSREAESMGVCAK